MGIVYKLKTHRLPSGSPTSKGKALVNLCHYVQARKKITTTMPYNPTDENSNIIFATSLGNIRRNKLTDFHNINANGKIAMKLKDNDNLVNVVVLINQIFLCRLSLENVFDLHVMI